MDFETREDRMMAEFETKVARMYEDLDMPLIPRMFLYGNIMELKGAILESFIIGRTSEKDMNYVIGRCVDLMEIVCDACIAPGLAANKYLSDADIAAEFREIRALRTKLADAPSETPEPSVH